jgi:hypothetical protein
MWGFINHYFSVIMNPSQNISKTNNSVESKEGQRNCLDRGKKLPECPILKYEYCEAPDKLNKAFDMLFEEMFTSIRNKIL